MKVERSSWADNFTHHDDVLTSHDVDASRCFCPIAPTEEALYRVLDDEVGWVSRGSGHGA